jgi:hypothetical protein
MEPEIIINGVRLTEGQAMTLRVALSMAEWDCGEDDLGKQMTDGYKARTSEIFSLMRTTPRTNDDP